MENTGEYGYFGGTSAAAPYVTGSIGLLYAIDSYELSNDIIDRPADVALKMKKYLINGVVQIDDLKDQTSSGGRLNIMQSIIELSKEYQINTSISKDNFKLLNFDNNGTTNGVFVRIMLKEKSSVEYELLDINGRHVCFGKKKEMPSGIHRIEIGENGIVSGVYYIKWSVQGGGYPTRIMKL